LPSPSRPVRIPALRRIAILLHERDVHAEKTHYIVWALRSIWTERGIEVVTLRGTAKAPEADLLIPHIDLSVIPAEYARFMECYPRVLNRGVRDVSKTAISSLLVRPGDGYEGPVIVKTDRNCGGAPERRILGRQRRPMLEARRLLRRLAGRSTHPLALATTLDSSTYPVYESPGEVPEGVFENPVLVVERFVPERAGDRYCLRNYTFLGSQHMCSRRSGPRPVVKAVPGAAREQVEVPAELEAKRRRLGFDYGKFDFVIRDGEPVLLDANPTPTYAGDRLTPAQRERAELLADGLEL
jgi:hypothetical protein